MTPGEAVSRKQRGILDDTGHADVSVEESMIEAWRRCPKCDSMPDGPDSNGANWDFDYDNWATVGDWLAEPESTPIYDALILADLASQAPRPSLWTRIAAWFR